MAARSGCGSATELLHCRDSIGGPPSEEQITGALESGDMELDRLAGDAGVLVGEERAGELVDAAAREIEAEVEARSGHWFLDEAAAEAALAESVSSTVTSVYARPMERVGALDPIPGDIERAGHVAADAFLHYLGDYDLRGSEYRRSLEGLVGRWPQDHLFALEDIRRGGLEEWRDVWVVVTSWMSSYSEVRVEPETGEVSHVYLEVP